MRSPEASILIASSLTRSYVESPEREEDELPTATQEPAPAVERTPTREPLWGPGSTWTGTF